MKRLLTLMCCSALLTVGLALAGCGGDDDDDMMTIDAPAASPDAPVATPDATPMGTTCDDYCLCMNGTTGTNGNCPGSFPDTATCLAECNALQSTGQNCRKDHCGFAAGGNMATHCPHARGESLCP